MITQWIKAWAHWLSALMDKDYSLTILSLRNFLNAGCIKMLWIPACPSRQRLEILINTLAGCRGAVGSKGGVIAPCCWKVLCTFHAHIHFYDTLSIFFFSSQGIQKAFQNRYLTFKYFCYILRLWGQLSISEYYTKYWRRRIIYSISGIWGH